MLLNMALVWLMILFSKWYIIYLFEMIFWNYFLSPKKGLSDRHFEIAYFSISGQHNLLKDFLWFPFRNDIWLSFRNEQCVPIFILKCFMTVILKWGGKIFVHKIIFVRRNHDVLLTKIQLLLLFSYTVFYARLGTYPCVKI